MVADHNTRERFIKPLTEWGIGSIIIEGIKSLEHSNANYSQITTKHAMQCISIFTNWCILL